MRAIIVTGRLVQDVEFVYPFYRLQEAGFGVDVAVRGKQPCAGIIGVKIEPTMDIPIPGALLGVENWDLLIIPGGVKAMEHMRLDDELVHYVADFHKKGGVIGCICSGAQLLISAGLCKGRRISAYPAIKVDVENAGGTYCDGVANCERIVTAPHYRDLGAWMAEVLREVERHAIRPDATGL